MTKWGAKPSPNPRTSCQNPTACRTASADEPSAPSGRPHPTANRSVRASHLSWVQTRAYPPNPAGRIKPNRTPSSERPSQNASWSSNQRPGDTSVTNRVPPELFPGETPFQIVTNRHLVSNDAAGTSSTNVPGPKSTQRTTTAAPKHDPRTKTPLPTALRTANLLTRVSGGSTLPSCETKPMPTATTPLRKSVCE